MLVVEQNVHSALQVADRAYVMNLGRIVHEGPAAQLRERRGAAPRSCWGCDGATPLLHVERLAKQYTRGLISKQVTFSLAADFTVDRPAVVGVMGPNGSGKTTLFELITGSNLPTAGRVLVDGQDIHAVRTRERDRLAIHYHQSYQVRSFQRSKPDFMLEHAPQRVAARCTSSTSRSSTRRTATSASCWTSSGSCAASGKLVFLCLHPNEPYHIDILRESCERFIFVQKGVVTQAPDFDTLVQDERVRSYLGGRHGGLDPQSTDPRSSPGCQPLVAPGLRTSPGSPGWPSRRG